MNIFVKLGIFILLVSQQYINVDFITIYILLFTSSNDADPT